MAAFMVGKSLKDRRQNKAIEDLFDKADKNGNGKISVEEYVHIFSDHGIQLRYVWFIYDKARSWIHFGSKLSH